MYVIATLKNWFQISRNPACFFAARRGFPYTCAAMKQQREKLSFDIDAVIAGKARLSDEQAMELYRGASMHDLGQWANAAAQRTHPEDYRTYVIDRNINYT